MRSIHTFVFLHLIVALDCGWESRLRSNTVTVTGGLAAWKDAQSYCRKNHLDMLTIQSREEYQRFSNVWGWIGLHRVNETSLWKWSRGEETAIFFNWGNNVPVPGFNCVAQKSGTWYNFDCESLRFVSCYEDNLILVRENKTWDEALEHCRSLGMQDIQNSRYGLVSLISEDDHVYARERAQLAITDEVWTGLRYLGDNWLWMGGEPVQYQNISSCPAFSCGVLEKNGNASFGIRACSEQRNFFCYKKP